MKALYQKAIRSMSRLYPEGLFEVSGLPHQSVALTIDDGPSSRTNEILDLLDKFNARATFFLHSDAIKQGGCYVDQLQRMMASGHEIANHMPDHRPSVRLDPSEFEREFERAHETLSLHGASPTLFRAAGGFYHPSRMLPSLRRLGYYERFIMASYLPWDTHFHLPTTYARHLAQGAFPGAIFVLHDGEAEGKARLARTIRTLAHLLPELRNRGYEIEPLGELLDPPGVIQRPAQVTAP